MGETSFNRQKVAPAEPEAEAGVKEPELKLAIPTKQVEGEITARDIIIPRVKVIQKIDDLSERFPTGSVVFNEEVQVADGKDPMDLVAVSLTKKYIEVLPFGTEERPAIFDTADAAKAAGYQLDEYDEAKYVAPMVRAIVLIPEPKDDTSGLFVHAHSGRNWALAEWVLRSSAYTSAGKTLLTAAVSHLRDGLHHGLWHLTTTKRSNSRNTWQVPVLKSAGRNDPEFADWANGLLKH